MNAVITRYRPRSLLLFILAWFSLSPAVVQAEQFAFEDVKRVVSFGDVHGAFDELTGLLQQVGVVDEELAWSGGETHLVSLGDLLHRGDYGRQVMDLLMRLHDEALDAGGKVHVVLGNHEKLALSGDFRYVSEGDYAQFGSKTVGDLPPGFVDRRRAFAPDGEYGSWLLELPAIVRIDDTVFLHGGLSSLLDGLSIDEINRRVSRDLRLFAEGWHVLLEQGALSEGDEFSVIRSRAAELADDPGQQGLVQKAASDVNRALKGLAFNPDGPLWHRGNARCHPFTETEPFVGVLEQLDAARVVMGHTPTPDRRISSRLEGRAYVIDTGMNADAYQGRPSALIIEGEQIKVFYADEGEMEIVAEPNRVWPRPYGMSDEEIEQFLETAEITNMVEIGVGVTGARRLTLERDGKTMRAAFKTIETDRGLERRRSRWSREADHADRYLYEVAAYRLDRLIGLEMVPVTVLRTIDGEEGSVQYWIENAFNETRRREENIAFTGLCRLQPQFDLMNVFDILIYNVDRNLGDILYDPDWRLWLIDHSRSFSTRRGIPQMIDGAEINVTPQMREALKRVTEDSLGELEPYLHSRQISALVNRARWIRQRL